MSLATGNQDHSRADHEQTAEDVEDRGTDATGAGQFGALVVRNSGNSSAFKYIEIQLARDQFGQNGLSNIVMMFRKDIANQIYRQMMQHFFVSSASMQEEVVDVSPTNISPYYNYETQTGLFDPFTGSIRSVLFGGIEHGVFPVAKFDSLPELTFARVLERDAKSGKVSNWLRPADQEFNISYNHGRHYRPDFVVETSEFCYLVEIKGSHMLNDPDVIAKRERAVRYCEVASAWCRENGYREWRHLFIPDNQISEGSTFAQLAASCLVL